MILAYILGGLLISYGILASINLMRFRMGSFAPLSASAAIQLSDNDMRAIQTDAYCQQGILLHRLSDFSGAISKYEKAIELGGINEQIAQHIKFAQASHPLPQSLPSEQEAYATQNADIEVEFSPLQKYLDKREEEDQKTTATIDSGQQDSAQAALAFLKEGQSYHQKGMINESISAYGQAIKADPQFISAYIHRAMALIKTKNYSEALDDLTTILNEEPENADILYKRANIYLHQNLLEEAIKDYTAVLNIEPKSAKAFNRRGTAFFRKENYTYAVADFSKALAIDPDFTEAHDNLARAKQMKIEQIREQAEKQQQESKEAIGETGIPESSEQIFYQGVRNLQEKDIAKALVSFNRVIRAVPDNPFPYFERGCIHLSNNRYEIAIADLGKVIELDPDFGDAYCQRGQALAGLHKEEEALADFNKALSLNPKSRESLLQRGLCFGRLKKNIEAIADFSQLIEMDSNNGQAYYQRGLLWRADKNEALAEIDFNKACKLGINEACAALANQQE